ncbi:hypothetical protein F5146DRAFT_1145763 [Armillaria mellea]|nr:hypothetical protein F5146DRAFT_1145763 [Armillaria mellea]
MSAHRTPKDDAMLQHKSLSDDIATLVAWVEEVYSQWAVCDQFWQRAGIKKKVWHDLEFRLVEVIDNIDQDDIGDSQAEFNALTSCVRKYGGSPIVSSPQPGHPATVSDPQLAKTSPIATPTPPLNPPVPNPLVATSSTILESNQFSAAFKANESSFGAPILLQSSTHSQTIGQSTTSGTSSTLLTVNTASHTRVFPGPDPTWVDEGSGPSTPSKHQSLFFAGMDDDDKNANNNKSFDESTGATVIPLSAAATVPMVFDQIIDDDTAASPPPATSVWCHHQPVIKFVFDDVIGDFLEAHPTIFLTRPPSQDQDKEIEPHHSTRPHILPPTLNIPQNPMDKGTKKHKTPRSTSQDKKDSKGKEKTGVSLKCARFADEEVPAGDQPATKKSKGSKGMVAVHVTPIVRKQGPGLSKLPPILLGVSGGGFGENVSEDFEPIDDGLKSVRVLVVEADYGDFVKVDGHLWNKSVAPFVGERYSKACDQCKSRKTQCQKLLGHTVICVHCHYAKQPCTINGDTILNPVDHYCPKGSSKINAFKSALNALEQSNQASIQVQVSCLHACLPSNEDDEDNSDGADDEDDEIEEGVAGPSSWKSQSD